MLAGAIQAGVSALVPCAHGLASLVRTLRRYPACSAPAHDRFALTERELEVVSLLGAGHSVPQMAKLMRISPRTVENHKRRIYVKLGVGNQIHAVSQATSMGLINGGTEDLAPPRAGAGQPRALFVVVCGPPGRDIEQVAEALTAAGVPFGHADPLRGAGNGGARVRPSAIVLVDPEPEDWHVAAGVGGPSLLVLYRPPDLPALTDALLRGVRCLVRGRDVEADLATLVRLVAHGYSALPTEHLDELVSWLGLPGQRPAVPSLTTREADILGSIALGHTVRQTARSLGIAIKTVENTQARLFRKLGAHNRSGALTIAYRLGLVDPANALAANEETAVH
jgi:DNA-binding NarL/FixJ family response regulator